MIESILTLWNSADSTTQFLMFALAGLIVWSMIRSAADIIKFCISRIRHNGNGNGNGKAVDVTNDRIDAIGKAVHQHSEDIGALKNAVLEIKEFRKETKENFEKFGKRIGDVEEILDELKRK